MPIEKGKEKLFVFILSYNHAKTILDILDRIPKSTWERVSEVLIADDCSKDRTDEIALMYKQTQNLTKLKIIRHEKNKGYGGNQKFCYEYAIKKGYDIAAMLHGDLQYPPEFIEPLAELMIKKDAGMVFGSRMSGDPRKGGMPFYKFLGNKFLTTTENLILGTKLSEFHSGFRLYNLKHLKQIPFQKLSDNYHFDSEIIVQLLLAKKLIDEITIPTKYGDEDCNVNSFHYGLNILKVMSQYIMHTKGIKKFDKFDIETKQ